MEAEGMAASMGILPEDALVRLEYVQQDRLGKAKAAAYGFKFAALDDFEIPHSAIECVPESVARENKCVPINFDG